MSAAVETRKLSERRLSILSTALKVLGLAIAFAGLIAGAGNIRGWFSYPERAAILRQIRSEGQIARGVPAFDDLLLRFPPPPTCARDTITAFATTTSIQSGGYVTPTGPLKFEGCAAQPNPPILFDDLSAWANTSAYPWLGWSFSLLGWLITAAGVSIDLVKRKSESSRAGSQAAAAGEGRIV